MKFDIKNIPLYLIYVAPTVHLAFGKRFGDLFNILTITCLIYLFRNGIEGKITNKKLFYYFSFLFFAYPLEIFISQLMRWQWRIHDYMDQIRFIFAFPVFLYLIDKRIDLTRYIETTIPVALIFSYFFTKYVYMDNQFGDRFTNNFTDPLAYGEICLSMSLLLVTTFFNEKSNSLILNLYKLTGIFFGLIISIKTQSRTGWLAIPIITLVLLYLNKRQLNIKLITGFSIISVLILFGLYFYVDIVHLRVNQAIIEVLDYPWNGGIAPDTSVGLRITFNRLGLFYISHNPWYGMGDKGFIALLNSPEIKLFADREAIQISFEKLFHSEIITQMVRYGILGLVGYILLLIIPIFVFIRKYNSEDVMVKNTSIVIIVFIISQIVAGISDEILNLKYMILYFMLLNSIAYSIIVTEKKTK